MYRWILLFAVLLPLRAVGQELVPNGGFETYLTCPKQDNLLSEAAPWYNPNKASPDFYNYCYPTDQIELPPRTGRGLARLFMDKGWAEYLSTPLKESLKAGEAYEFELYLSTPSPSRYPAGSFGAYLSKTAMSASDKGLFALSLSEKPQVIDNMPQRFTKPFTWERVGGCFVAKGGESHLTVGNFVQLPPTLGFYYLFVDDISVKPIRVNLGNDTTLCGRKSTLKLDAKTPGATEYKWNTGSTTRTVLVTRPGTYCVTVTTPCKVVSDTITVKYVLDYSLGADTTLCNGATMTLRVAEPGEYQWQDGTLQNTFLVQQAGNYHVQVRDDNCVAKDTINVGYVEPPRLNLGPNKQLCGAELYTLVPNYGAGMFRWLDAFPDEARTVATSGFYAATVTNDCATIRDTVTVDYTGCECTIYAPNAFSPNADDLNDVFQPVVCGDISLQSLSIYNRWGEIIFQTNAPPFRWDGTYNGAPCPAAIYTWQIAYTRKQPDKPTLSVVKQSWLFLGH